MPRRWESAEQTKARSARAFRSPALPFDASYLHPKPSGKIIQYRKVSSLKQTLAVALLVFAVCGSAAVWKHIAAPAKPALRTKEVPSLEIAHQHIDQLQQFPESFP